MSITGLQTPPASPADLRCRLGSFLIAVAGTAGDEVASRGNLLWTAAKQLGERDLAQAATIAEAAWKARKASSTQERAVDWGNVLLAAETILENELARLDRAAPASGEEVA